MPASDAPDAAGECNARCYDYPDSNGTYDETCQPESGTNATRRPGNIGSKCDDAFRPARVVDDDGIAKEPVIDTAVSRGEAPSGTLSRGASDVPVGAIDDKSGCHAEWYFDPASDAAHNGTCRIMSEANVMCTPCGTDDRKARPVRDCTVQ